MREPDAARTPETPAEHVAFARAWVDESQAAVDQGVKTEQEHARTVRATLSDALRFLDRFGNTMPEEDDDGSDW
jgi:hypothetical protein